MTSNAPSDPHDDTKVTTRSERTDLEPSEELRSITARLWSAWTRGDVEAVIGRFSLKEGVSGFGTDPTEFFRDPGQLERYTRAEFDALGGGWPLGSGEV